MYLTRELSRHLKAKRKKHASIEIMIHNSERVPTWITIQGWSFLKRRITKNKNSPYSFKPRPNLFPVISSAWSPQSLAMAVIPPS